ncbi:MAG: hypothetical protein KatS3mg108_0353 [Isosphaeraceae bacterium]|jgi:4-amino-4-deoxy-L-arabinose transferase-like glycosyltransferase|nr:MAG: hypothetical protein KatS3mg108_0353 [Isosphaeraceae bacterium]
MPGGFGSCWRRWGPELTLGLLAAVILLACLGSMELWGKREQRAVAESIDTVTHGHWLVAEIQSRPRLEKPPLPRWVTALLITLTGRRDEWLMRLPAALSALGMVALTYGLGRRIAGRQAGLASASALLSILYFVVEMRQAGNDGPLAFFVTLAVYAGWRRLHGHPPQEPPGLPAERLGSPRWAILMYAALGLGFLCKGPIALLLVALALIPYLALARRLRPGLAALANGWGLLLLILLALSWPVPVLLNDPKAWEVWKLEMAQKTGTAGIAHHRDRSPLLLDWPSLTAPWTIFATLGVIAPWLRSGRSLRPTLWLPWAWAVVNLAMFSLWSVAKPNYYLPCLPAAALLAGIMLVRTVRIARCDTALASRARRLLYGHWLVIAAVGLALPAIAWKLRPEQTGWVALGGIGLALACALSYRLWRAGADTTALYPLLGGLGLLVLIAYGIVAPTYNPRNGHRTLAAQLASLLPPDQPVVMFYRELDEGLWYYLQNRQLKPVPGSQPRYNKGFDLLDDYRQRRLILDDQKRYAAEAQTLIDWIDRGTHESPYMLIRAEVYDLFRHHLGDRLLPLYRESGVQRNELMLVKVRPTASPATLATQADTAAARK